MKKSENTSNALSRRQFIGTSLTLAAGFAIGTKSAFGHPSLFKIGGTPHSRIRGVQIGAITYSYRSMPDQSAEAILKYVVDSGISAIELMGDPAENFAGKPKNTGDRAAYQKQVADWRASVSMDKFAELRKMYNDAGVTIYAWKPSAFGKNNTDAEIDYGFRVAKVLGATHVTREHPGNDAETEKLGKFAARHKIYMAYHAHTQATPTLWDTALKQSKYNAINLDLGHFVAAGNPDPIGFIKAKHDRIMSMHLKDRKTKAHGQANLPWGEGDTPIIQALQLMRDKKYKFPGSVELEYKIPEGSDAVKEVVKCLAYSRKALES